MSLAKRTISVEIVEKNSPKNLIGKLLRAKRLSVRIEDAGSYRATTVLEHTES